jgi:hypothetical protein
MPNLSVQSALSLAERLGEALTSSSQGLREESIRMS